VQATRCVHQQLAEHRGIIAVAIVVLRRLDLEEVEGLDDLVAELIEESIYAEA
jgi:hypothetical protein